MWFLSTYDVKLTTNISSEGEEEIHHRFVQILTLRGVWLTSVTQNTAYARSQTQQVYANTFPIDILAELTVNSRQKPEWLWQVRDIGLPRMSVNASSSILNADKTKQNRLLANSRWRVSIPSAHALHCALAQMSLRRNSPPVSIHIKTKKTDIFTYEKTPTVNAWIHCD